MSPYSRTPSRQPLPDSDGDVHRPPDSPNGARRNKAPRTAQSLIGSALLTLLAASASLAPTHFRTQKRGDRHRHPNERDDQQRDPEGARLVG